MVLRKNMDNHTKKCVFRLSRCEYCGAETTFNHIEVSKSIHTAVIYLNVDVRVCVEQIDTYHSMLYS